VLLAIDTATRVIGIALHNGGEILAEHVWHSKDHHTVQLAPEVALTLRKANLSTSGLTAVAVASGPGSYTGLRIGMALAKGIALAHNLSMIGVPTLDILAHSQPRLEEPMFALIQAGRGRIAGVWYRWANEGWVSQSEPVSMTWDELMQGLEGKVYLCGEIGSARRNELREVDGVTLPPPAQNVRRPGYLAEIAWSRLRTKKTDDPITLAPIYLHPQDVL
jgi:tRNA threonylcarbamoyladenosine biosynthesis protein TsaB